MKRLSFVAFMIASFAAEFTMAADWTQFRGPGGLGSSDEKGLPVTWSSTKNIAWKTKLPGPGTSSPITLGESVFLTCYSGYGLNPGKGEMAKLMRHVLCLDRKSGKILWTKNFKPALPESRYSGGNNAQHGYAASTPATDGKRLYVFFGKSGVYCLDLKGEEIWHASVGKGTHGWGSATSPVLYKDLVIINASVESGALVALNKMTGEEVWRTAGIRSSWNTPVLVNVPGGETELALSLPGTLLGLDPSSGKELWRSKGHQGYICPSLVAHEGVIYGIRNAAIALRAGGRGDVSGTHELWRTNKGSVVSSPVYYKGHIYWVRGGGGAYCLNAANGEILFQKRLKPNAGVVYSSVIVADGKLYCASQHNGVYVLAAEPKFKQLAHNTFEDDDSRTNASLIVSRGQLLMRTDRYLYCIGK